MGTGAFDSADLSEAQSGDRVTTMSLKGANGSHFDGRNRLCQERNIFFIHDPVKIDLRPFMNGLRPLSC